MDGLQALERLKGHPDLEAIPEVRLTRGAVESDAACGYDLGVNASGVKPVGFPGFLEAPRELSLFRAVVTPPSAGSISRGAGR